MQQFWTSLFGSWDAPIISEQADYTIWSLSLTGDFIIQNINFDTKTDVNTFNNPLKDGVSFVSKYERSKNINMKITVKGDDKDSLISNLDELRKEVYGENVNIDVKFKAWEVRRIKANCVSWPINIEHYNCTFITLDISFETIEPFWYKINNQVLTRTGITANFREEITAETAKSDLSVYIFFWTLTGTTSVSLTDQRKTITITETFASNDVLVINGLDRSVKLNGSEIDYDGEFLEIFPNTNFIDIDIDGSWEADFVFVNRKNYV